MSNLASFFLNQADTAAYVQFVYDVSAGRVVFVNAAYEAVLHGHRDQVNEELPALLARLHPDDHAYLARYWQLWLQGRMTDEAEVRLLTPGRPEQWFSLIPSCQQAADGTMLLGGTLRDISVAKHYQQNADNFNTRKNATLEILSHDLSNAFIVVQQIAEFLSEEVPTSADGRVAELLGVLQSTSRNSVEMIRDFIRLEFLAATNTDLKLDRVEVGTTLRPPLEELQHQQALLGHHFDYALPTEPVYAYLDVNKFTQVLTNLISNAIKFTPDGGHIAVQIEPRPDSVRIRVQDNGIGIPSALPPVLFERFTKARRPGLRGEQTTGLGLALCKMIVEWHHGVLSAVSTDGQGSTFTIEIPRAEA